MVKLSAQNITSFLIYNNEIKEDERDVYQYGFETLIASTLYFITVLCLGNIFDKFIHTLLFMLCYCPIRQFSGGYHADSYRECFMTFISLYLINVCTLNIFIHKIPNIVVILIVLLCAIGIAKLSPQEHRNNPLSAKEKEKYKKIVKRLVIFYTILITLLLTNNNTYEYGFYIASAIYLIFIMLILGKYKN